MNLAGVPMQNPYGMPNPYAAPTGPAGPAYRAKGHGPVVKWLYLVCYLMMFAMPVLGILLATAGSATGDDDAAGVFGGIGILFIGVAYLFLFVMYAMAMTWVYKSWDMIPDPYRFTRSGRKISPAAAFGYLFIPFYNLYWIFAMTQGYCDALDYLLSHYGSTRRAPRGLAIAAGIVQVIPYMNFLFAPILWFIFMVVTDSAKKEVAGFLAGDPAFR